MKGASGTEIASKHGMGDGLGATREKGALENGNDIISGGGVLNCGEKSAFVPYSSCDLERGRESGVWMDKERSSSSEGRLVPQNLSKTAAALVSKKCGER